MLRILNKKLFQITRKARQTPSMIVPKLCLIVASNSLIIWIVFNIWNEVSLFYKFLPVFSLNFLNKDLKNSFSEAVAWCIHANMSPMYLIGSWELSSIGLGLWPFGPPLVRASINNLTMAFLRELQYSSNMYLFSLFIFITILLNAHMRVVNILV